MDTTAVLVTAGMAVFFLGVGLGVALPILLAMRVRDSRRKRSA